MLHLGTLRTPPLVVVAPVSHADSGYSGRCLGGKSVQRGREKCTVSQPVAVDFKVDGFGSRDLPWCLLVRTVGLRYRC